LKEDAMNSLNSINRNVPSNKRRQNGREINAKASSRNCQAKTENNPALDSGGEAECNSAPLQTDSHSDGGAGENNKNEEVKKMAKAKQAALRAIDRQKQEEAKSAGLPPAIKCPKCGRNLRPVSRRDGYFHYSHIFSLSNLMSGQEICDYSQKLKEGK